MIRHDGCPTSWPKDCHCKYNPLHNGIELNLNQPKLLKSDWKLRLSVERRSWPVHTKVQETSWNTTPQIYTLLTAIHAGNKWQIESVHDVMCTCFLSLTSKNGSSLISLAELHENTDRLQSSYLFVRYKVWQEMLTHPVSLWWSHTTSRAQTHLFWWDQGRPASIRLDLTPPFLWGFFCDKNT